MSEFIETLAPFAIKHGTENGILPSLILAQGIHETGGGTSELAREANNLFGIKKGSGWDGEVYSVVTHEYRKNAAGEDEKYFVTAEFRKYDSYEGAVIDLCDKYTQGLDWEAHNRYAAVVNNFIFAAAAQAVKDAGYATDPNYPALLVRTYETYNLAQYDIAAGFEKLKEDNAMAFKVAIGAGHGKHTPGKRTPAGEREWTFNNVVVRAAIDELNKYEGVQILRLDDPDGSSDVSLTSRTNKANAFGADVLVSCHHNAIRGTWGTWSGVETFVMTPASANPGSMKLAKEVHPRVVKAMGISNRGIKAANFHMLRESHMPAILVEGGFMDSTIDIKKMRNNKYLKAQGVAIAQGIAAYGNLKRKSAVKPVSNDRLYRVRYTWADDDSQIGAYSVLQGAKDVAYARRDEGFVVFDEDGDMVYNPPKYSMNADERLGEVILTKDGGYYVLPRASSYNMRTLRKGHQCHFYDKEGDFYRLGTGWTKASDLKVTRDYRAEEAAEKAKAEAEALAKAEAEKAAEEAREAAEKLANDEQAKLAKFQAEAAEPHAYVGLIVTHGSADFTAAYDLHVKTGYPVMTKDAAMNDTASHIIVVGGNAKDFVDKAEFITLLSGNSAVDTAVAVAEYLKQ